MSGLQHLTWRAGDPDGFLGRDSLGRELRMMAHDGSGGSKPSDLVPLSLAACLGYTTVMILQKQRQDLRELDATIETEQDEDPPWEFRRIAVRFVARGVVDEQKARKALAQSHEKYCSVSATLLHSVAIDLEITVEPVA